MANEDHDGAAASTGPGDGPNAPRSGSSLRTSLDEAKLRLDSPLFKRDAGMSAGEMPKLRELTWDHVVNPTSQVPTVASESAAAGAPGAGAALLERLQDGAEGARLRARAAPEEQIVESPPIESEPVASVEAVRDPVDQPVPATIEALLARPSATGPQVDQTGDSGPVTDVVSAPSWSTEPDTGPSVNELVALVRQDSPRIPRVVEPVSDLAELLRRPEQASPASVDRHAEPVSEPVSETPVEPVVAPVVEPVVELSVEPVVAPVVEAAEAAVSTAPTLPPSAPAPPIATSSVQAELDRLAYVPDREEAAGPISIPTIAVGTPPAHPPAPPVPSLSQSGAFAPRVSGAPVSKPSYVEAAAPTQVVVKKKRKRHVVRKLFTLLIVLGLIGGGVYAVKRYVLDAVKWSGDAGTLAADVELERGLKFAMPVAVTELTVDEYASNVAALALGVTDDNSDSVASEFRALGLLSGTLDLRAIGMSALGDSPAYYDSSSETIFVVAGLPEDLRQFAMHRALALALLDQKYGWGERSQTASPSQARGIRAVYDGDALETATAMVDLADRATVIKQIFGLYATYDIPTTPSPFASAIIGRLGLTTAPYFSGLADDDRAAIVADAMPTDGEALDLRRLLDGTAETPSPASRGMLYWYHVLAARVDNDIAWRVALSWKDDDVKVAPGPSGACVTAVVGVDALAVAAAQEAFQAWAAAAPATTPATVVVSDVVSAKETAAGIREITISACDPGPSVQTNDGRVRLSLGGAPLRAAQYEQLARSQPGLAPQQIACTVFGLDPVSAPADERGIMDPVEGWPALAAHPEPDPATSGCLPA